MKRILYSSGEFLTDDAIADAIMEYATVLALVDSADVVECLGIDDSGSVRRMRLLVGPASQILVMDSDEPNVEMDVAGTVTELRRRSRHRLPTEIDIADAEADDSAGNRDDAE